jgi:hypothetical protein
MEQGQSHNKLLRQSNIGFLSGQQCDISIAGLAAIPRGYVLLRILVLAIEKIAAEGVAAAQAAEAAGKKVEEAEGPAWTPEDVTRVINQAVTANGYTALHWWVVVPKFMVVGGSKHTLC